MAPIEATIFGDHVALLPYDEKHVSVYVLSVVCVCVLYAVLCVPKIRKLGWRLFFFFFFFFCFDSSVSSLLATGGMNGCRRKKTG